MSHIRLASWCPSVISLLKNFRMKISNRQKNFCPVPRFRVWSTTLEESLPLLAFRKRERWKTGDWISTDKELHLDMPSTDSYLKFGTGGYLITAYLHKIELSVRTHQSLLSSIDYWLREAESRLASLFQIELRRNIFFASNLLLSR